MAALAPYSGQAGLGADPLPQASLCAAGLDAKHVQQTDRGASSGRPAPP